MGSFILFAYIDTVKKEFSSKVKRAISNKVDSDTLISLLSEHLVLLKTQYLASVEDSMDTSEGNTGTKTKPAEEWNLDSQIRDVIVQHILHSGSKSFSHLLNIIERFLRIT